MRSSLLLMWIWLAPLAGFGQLSKMMNTFDYKNVNAQTFIPMQGWNAEQQYMLSVLKYSFEMQHIINNPRDTLFFWNGLTGEKVLYTQDSLLLFVLRPSDTISRPCILLTHGNNAKYRSSWNENMNFYAIDLAMRGYVVAYYENPSSWDARELSAQLSGNNAHILAHARNAFYYGFQSSIAAAVYVRHQASFLHIDTTRIFAGGFSFGAFLSLMLATADPGYNFSDSLFASQGNFNANALYNDPYHKQTHYVFSMGGGLPKDDTLALNNSHMGTFADARDSGLSILFLHGRTDNFVSFDQTRFFDTLNAPDYFIGEGPRALANNIREDSLPISSRLWVNCRGGHNFLTAVCGYSNPYCLAQFQWPYLPEPMGDLSNTNSYYRDSLTDTLLHYFAYMMTQVNDVGLVIGDFLQPGISGDTSVFSAPIYFIQPRDSFTYANSSGHYIIRNTDCEGHALVITTVHENPLAHTVRIYPNPASKSIRIASEKPMEKICIYQLDGALVKMLNGNHALETAIDIGQLATGEYICNVVSSDGVETLLISVVR